MAQFLHKRILPLALEGSILGLKSLEITAFEGLFKTGLPLFQIQVQLSLNDRANRQGEPKKLPSRVNC